MKGKAIKSRFGRWRRNRLLVTPKQAIIGYKLQLVITLAGGRDFELAPAYLTTRAIGFELLVEHTNLMVIGDKAY